MVAGVGFEPHDLRVMSPTSYRTAPPRVEALLLYLPYAYLSTPPETIGYFLKKPFFDAFRPLKSSIFIVIIYMYYYAQ